MVLKLAPISTGESTTVVSEAGWNSMVSPDSRAIGNAVPYRHPRGTFSVVWRSSWSEGVPAGYISPWFQLIIPSGEVADEPELKPPATSAGDRKSKDTSMEVTPCGTSTAIINNSTGSRRQTSVLPPPVIFKPTRSVTGPLGACSPGIHLG